MQKYGIVYRITNKVNQKRYIGITTKERGFNGRYSAKGNGIERVYNFYTYQKKNGQFYNIHLLNSIEKYGFDAFEVDEEFEVCYSKEQLKETEKKWIAYYKSNDYRYGYNRTLGGDEFLSGKDHPRYDSIEFNCDCCGKPVVRNKARFNRSENNYCSKECKDKGYIGRYTGKNNPNYNSVKLKCDYCNKEIIKRPSVITKNNYCSTDCYKEHQKTTMLGSNNPNFGNEGKVSGSKNGRARKVICITTGEIFDCILDGANKYGINKTGIVCCCTDRQKTAGKLADGTKLEWKYYESA